MNIFIPILIQPLANGLILFYKFFGNMGLAIIGFSLFLRLVLNPLTAPYMESMRKMKEFEPQLAKLKKKYKDDKTKFIQAQADFYKEKGINPSSGCLPYLLQIIVLFALFNVFMTALSPNGNVVGKLNALLYGPLKFNTADVINTHFIYLDITKPDTFKAPGFPFSLPGPILILAALVQFLSTKIMAPYTKIEEKVAKRTAGSADDISVAMQESMSYTFPLFTIIFGMGFPSGLALYWLIFSFFQLYQQYRTSGWGGLTPWISQFSLLKSSGQNEK